MIRILPDSVRYALRYRSAKLGKEELRGLCGQGFENETIYLLVKRLVAQPDALQPFLEGLIDLLQESQPSGSLREYLMRTINGLTGVVAIPSAKLAQLSRQDFDAWDERYLELSAEYRNVGSVPVFVSSATLIGFVHFVRNLRSFYVLELGWVRDERNPYCGYLVRPHARQKVRFVAKEESFPKGAVIIDDTIRRGAHLAEALAFWESHGDPRVPVRILCDARPRT